MNRDAVANLLPGQLLSDLLPDGGLTQFWNDTYSTPTNRAEAAVHSKLLGAGYAPLRKGWPDFCVITSRDMFVVEVKQGSDYVRPSQRVVLSMLARAGIGSYVATKVPQSEDFHFEAVGDSTEWVDR